VAVADDGRRVAGDLRSRLREVVDKGDATILVDVTGLERLSSRAVADLLWARRECTARGGRVVLWAPTRASQVMLRRTELGRIFEVATAPTPVSPWRHP
jgi:anti-anti-sigma factor